MSDNLSKRLTALIKARGTTQRAVAKRAGVTDAAMSHYIKGDRTPTLAVTERLAAALGTSAAYLIDGTGCPDGMTEALAMIKGGADRLTYKQKLELIEALIPKDI